MPPKPYADQGVQKDMTSVAALGRDARIAPEHDAQLMMRVRAGEEACFTALLERHRNGVVHFIYRMVRSQHVAEELGQEVFLRVYRSRESYEPTAKFTTWLYRIATHVTLNWLRDHRRERHSESLNQGVAEAPVRQVPDRMPTAEQALLRESGFSEIREAVAALPDKQRAAVIMHKYQELEYSQIARILKCSDSAVKSLLFRAYETLRARLAHMA
jgi:RNA polymerase sigma-70 factor (ECF subfamily)